MTQRAPRTLRDSPVGASKAMAGFTAPSGYGLPCDIEGDAISQNSQKCRIFHNNAKMPKTLKLG